MLFWADYYLKWWRLPIKECACRKTDLGGGDYYLRNSGLPPSLQNQGVKPGWDIAIVAIRTKELVLVDLGNE